MLLRICSCVFILGACAYKQPLINKDTVSKPTITTKIIPKKDTTIKLEFPIIGAKIGSPFGWRWGRYHRGVDLVSPLGSNIYACADGNVIFAGRQKFLHGYGNAVMLSHGNKTYTYYAHLDKVLVKTGDKILSNTLLGKVGNTGNSTGPHLHLELLMDGRLHNPVPYFKPCKTLYQQIHTWVTSTIKSIQAKGGITTLTK
jgi:murein DD-endopeptidase MepM/ murein hydrolase activator NlpD